MKGLRKLLGLLVAAFMVFGMMAPAYAAPIPSELITQTKVVIHKIVATQFNADVPKPHNGGVLLPDDIAKLGTNAVENNTGVQFTVWKVEANAKLEDFADMTIGELNAIDPNPVLVNAGAVDKFFANGTYYVRETLRPATLEHQLGVPFIMELPVLNTTDDAYLPELHLYPKNIIENDMPVIDKDVKTKGQDHAGFDMGETFDYLIYPKVPEGIESYTLFKVYDKLNAALDYMGSIVVTYNGVPMIAGTDYEIAESPSETAGGEFTVTFKTPGLQKLGAVETPRNLEIKFEARINNAAVMGEEIYNNATLTYNNGYFEKAQETEVPEKMQPEVHTGGRQFIKVDNVTKEYLPGLASATFAVKKKVGEATKYMKKVDNLVTWVDALVDATIISLNNGEFEVTGLAYGDNGGDALYWLEEVTTPEGYVDMDDLEFKINAGSYAEENTMQVINVKRPLIPQTGGIGTIIFLATGLTLMGAAVVALRRKSQSDK